MDYGRKSITHQKKLLNSATKKFGTKAGITSIKFLLIMAIAVIVSGSCLIFGAIEGIIADAPDVSTIDVSPTGYASKIYNDDGEEIQMLSTSGSNRISVDIENVPLQLQHAFVAIEDERFYEHNGIDIKGIARAAYITLSNGDLSQGASTLTQQLLKNNVFNAYNETTIEKIKRKVQEQYLAVKLETYMDKQEILEDYLNTINLGNGYYGVQAAANGYFGKDVSELTLSECAVIASITQNPTKLNPVKNPDYNQERQQKVLRNMLAQGYISQEEYDEAIEDDVYARVESLDIATSTSTTYSYYVDALIDELIEDLKTQKGYTETQATNLIYKGGLQVYSTQDSSMQKTADSIINNPSYYPRSTEFSISYSLSVKDSDGKVSYYTHYGLLNWYKNELGYTDFSLTQTDEDTAKEYVEQYKEHIVGDDDTVLSESLTFTIQPQVSFSLMDQHTGYVKVLVGGRGDKTGNRTLNRATGTTRQPGSAIKPLAAYGPALDTGAITLATAIDDAPYYYSGSNSQLVTNFTKGEYRGLMSVREAIMLSQNVPAVKVLTQITPQVGFNYLEELGFSTLVSAKNAVNGSHDVVQSLALGGMTYGVKNIDMTAAYATIANQGTYIKPVYYTKVYDHNGNLLIDNTEPETQEVFKPTTAWLLTSALESVVNSGTARAARLSNQPVAGKTGTTQNETDKWFCAFTPYYTASIWIGYDDNSKVLPTSIDHRVIWRDIMSEISADQPTGSFPQPDGIVQRTVCSQSGKLPVAGLCDSDIRGSQLVTEYFASDNVPTESCDTHAAITICNDSGKVASAACTNLSTRVYIKKSSSGMGAADAAYAISDELMSDVCDGVHSYSYSNAETTVSNETTTSNNTQTDANDTLNSGPILNAPAISNGNTNNNNTGNANTNNNNNSNVNNNTNNNSANSNNSNVNNNNNNTGNTTNSNNTTNNNTDNSNNSNSINNNNTNNNTVNNNNDNIGNNNTAQTANNVIIP